MYRNNTVGVVVPAYNESGLVGDVIRKQPDYVDRIYVIDDRSTDDTWTEILAAGSDAGGAICVGSGGIGRTTWKIPETQAVVYESSGRVVPIRHRENRGVGGAIKSGYLQAREDRMDITVTTDADDQMDLGQMTRLLDPIVDGRADYTKGNRLSSRKLQDSMPTVRFVGNVLLTLLTRIASGYWQMMDSQNGYTAISAQALECIDVEDLFEYYGLRNELLVRLNVANMRVRDVPMEPVYGTEESHIRLGQFIPKVLIMLIQSFLWRMRTQYLK
ncbi:glycosyltransferase family 2 protein (plasmid) [Natronorubrum bangense]|nr:glycosyltransferase family 2 protein [Natronorubrum bangense]QCC56276.1 glycosyltransferase family 2 protein [Natronorubrum bangense]